MKINTLEIVDGHVVAVTRDMTKEEEATIENQEKSVTPKQVLSEEEHVSALEKRIAELESAVNDMKKK